jgi:hypothetical protein
MMTATERDAEIASFTARYKLAHRRLWGDPPRCTFVRCKTHPAVETSPAITFSDWLRLIDASKDGPVNPIPPEIVVEVAEPVPPLPSPTQPHVPLEAANAMADLMRHNEAPLHLSHFTANAVTEIVGAYFNITAEVILSSARKTRVVRARHIAIWLAREVNPQRSQLDLSRAMNRDHSTLFHAFRSMAWRIENEPATADAVAELRAILTVPRQEPTMAEIFAEAAVCESAD